jgi:hypothetical protein
MTKKLLNIVLAAALGFTVTLPLYAADPPQTSKLTPTAQWTDMDIHAAMEKCKSLTGSARSQCIVNIRPTPAADNGAISSGSSAPPDAAKDAIGQTEAQFAAAIKECESMDAADRDRCIGAAKEKFGRM